MKEVTLHVYEPGDNSAGISDAEWEVQYVLLDDDEHREIVRSAFAEAFETITAGEHMVYFSDERPE